MRYTIVTPTICRRSLLRLCESIDTQTESDWEHLVVVDIPRHRMTKQQREIIAAIPPNHRRSFWFCDRTHNNYGHTCRHQSWQNAKGDYVLYLDDDDYLAHKQALIALNCVTEVWAIFPVLRHGSRFLNLPPGTGNTGTGMFIHKKDAARWPDSDSYSADGLFVEDLKERYPYQVVDSEPLVVQPISSCGVKNSETWLGRKLAHLARRWVIFRSQKKRTGEPVSSAEV
jgi:glycosyltransferase involved in cell wall biosynthesis